MKKLIFSWITFIMLALPVMAVASGGGEHVEKAHINLKDKISLQRGAQIFVNNCQGCHSLKYIRYERMVDGLGLTEEQITENLMFADGKMGDQMKTAMNADDAAEWFGIAPPDLTLEAKLRSPDWLFSYLTSWEEDESRPYGFNNKTFKNVGMPNVLANMEAALGEEKFKGAMRDLTAFLTWASDPDRLERENTGVWVLLFLVFLLFPVIWLLNAEYWKDIH